MSDLLGTGCLCWRVGLEVFGLEAVPLHWLGRGIDLMLALGRAVSGLPGAVTPAASMPVADRCVNGKERRAIGLWCMALRALSAWVGVTRSLLPVRER